MPRSAGAGGVHCRRQLVSIAILARSMPPPIRSTRDGRTHRAAADQVLGVGISAINLNGAVAEIERWIARRERHHATVCGVDGVIESRKHTLDTFMRAF
jgi:hypothetical protein